MTGWDTGLQTARLLCAAAVVALVSAEAAAQGAPSPPPPPPPDAAELDPSAPLDPMPDLGVAWPDLKTSDTAPSPPAATITAPLKKKTTADDKLGSNGTGDIRYTLQVEGLAPLGNAEELLGAFRQQSTLEAERKKPANAAQIGRRANADADLLTELLRSQGYYDAAVEPSTEKVGDALRVVLTADPGAQYRFATVELPGLEAAGPEAAKLRDTFGVKPGDPVVATDVISGGVALTQALGEEGFAEAKLGDQDIEVNHQTH